MFSFVKKKKVSKMVNYLVVLEWGRQTTWKDPFSIKIAIHNNQVCSQS